MPHKKRGLTAGRNPAVTRMCRYCARPQRETAYPEGDGWICQPCRDNGILPIIPLTRAGEGWRFDTRMLFAGFRVFKASHIVDGTGARTEYETEVRSPAGVFYAVAEAAFAFEAKTARMANILRAKFPEARVQVSSDDGTTVLIFPARLELFQAVARRVGAFRPRTVTDETRARLAAAREVAAEKRAAANQEALAL